VDEDIFEGWPRWVRWTLVVPAGVLVPVVAVSIFDAVTHDWLASWLSDLIRVPGGAFLMVLTPALLAPKGKVVVAVIFGIFYTVVFVAVGSALLGSVNAINSQNVGDWMLQVALALVAVFLAGGLAWETERNLNTRIEEEVSKAGS
jgi:hypothetical protein